MKELINFDLEKFKTGNYELVTVEGRSARILATDLKGHFTIVCAILSKNGGTETIEKYLPNGHYCSDNSNDQRNLKMKKIK